MLGKSLFLFSALSLAALPGAAGAEGLDSGATDGITQGTTRPRDSQTGGQSYGDQNRGGSRGFYSYPRHRHVDGGRLADRGQDSAPSYGSAGTSPNYNATHGSAYYGPNYGAPYFGGGYYDDGVYYRERREH